MWRCVLGCNSTVFEQLMCDLAYNTGFGFAGTPGTLCTSGLDASYSSFEQIH